MNILYPAFAMFALTMFVQVRLGMKRFSAVRGGRMDPAYYRAYQGQPEPEDLAIYSRHLVNLYEAPVLFYAVVIIGFATGQSGPLPVALAWTYCLLRYLHSYIHLGSNRVLLRFRVFVASIFVLALLWMTVFLGLLLR